jgi:predicted lipoprotein with Yx(FWY)xxD motif
MVTKVNRRVAALAAIVVCTVATAVAATGAIRATVAAAHTSTLGSILVSASGRTLYHYLGDKGAKIGCTGACAAAWPPLLLTGGAKPVAGTGITASKLGSIKRPDGTIQVTYNKLPLYRFVGDTKAGLAKGQGLDKTWYAVAPSGALVKTAVGAASSTTSTTPPTTTASSGGYNY